MNGIQMRASYPPSWPPSVIELDEAGVGGPVPLDEEGQRQLSEINAVKFCYMSHWAWVTLAVVAAVVALAILPMVFAPKVAIYALCLCIGATTLATGGTAMAIYTKVRYDHFMAEQREAFGESAEATTRLPFDFFQAVVDPYSSIPHIKE